MLNSSNLSGSSRFSKNGLLNDKSVNAADESAGSLTRSFIQPKITSTPVRKEPLFLTPPKQHILSPRRYSLSDITTPSRANSRDLIKSRLYQNSTGPLLTSTKFNVNVSTYEETKSPGLARRIVQYNEEAEREKEHPRPPTHQAKYGSPGLFPIVHLFKKKTPTLEQKPRRVTVRIASPEYTRYYQDYNHRVLEGLFKPSTSSSSASFTQANGEPGTSARSVLDALKEISRKRIHSQEEYDFDEDSGKRQKTDLNNIEDSNKRLRDDSPLLDNLASPSKQLPKRLCMYDEYAASCSSTDYSFQRSDIAASKRKSVSTSTLTENPKDSKQVKLINAETQTLVDENDKAEKRTNVQEKDQSQKTEQTNKEIETPSPSKTQDIPLKIFDDAPLERIRKNRLAALMGSLTGKEPILTPKPPISSILNGELEESQSTRQTQLDTTIETNKPVEKPLVSILSTHKKSPQKSEKHVTFSLPESTSQTSIPTPVASFSSAGNTLEAVNASTSSSIISTTSIFSAGKSSFETSAPTSSPISTAAPFASFALGKAKESSSESNKTNVASAGFQYGSNKPMGSNQTPNFSFPTTSTATTSPTSNQFNLGSPKTIAAPTTPPKIGGFKFDLTKPTPEATSAASSPSTFSLPLASKTTENSSLFGNASVGTTSGFSFGSKTTNSAVSNATTTPSVSTGLTFGTTTTASSSGAPITSSSAGPTFNFNPFTTDSTPKSSSGFGFNVGSNTGVTTSKKVTCASSTFELGTAVTSPKPVFSFGSTNATTASASVPSTTASFNFTQPTSATTTVSSNFGTMSNTFKLPTISAFGSTTTGFGGTNVSSSFGTTTNPTFGTTPNSSFGTSGFGTSAASSNGGSSVPSTTSTPLAFGTSAQNTGFAASTTSASFGSSVTPGMFGSSTTAAGFGAPTAGFGTSVPSTGFGTSTTIAGFGTLAPTSGFGVPSTTSGNFGSTLPGFGATTTASSTFGSSSTSLFGKPTPAFGQNSTSTFGAPTTTATFGTANAFGGPTTTASSIFGSAAVPTSHSFGAPNSSNIFGNPAATQAPAFGAPNSGSIFATTTTSTAFGNTPTTSAFGAGTTTPAFSFGAKTTASSTFRTNVFGATTSAGSGFGASTTTSAFGTSTNTFNNASSFGSTSSFGSSNTPSFGATAVTQPSGFGSNNPPAFGTSEQGFGTTPKASPFGSATSTGFGTNTAAPPAFGANSTTAAFGATAPVSTFGASSTPTFGAGSSTSSFTAPNTFGSSSAFGTNQSQAAPGFGTSTNPPTTQTTAFNFGSGAASKPAVFSFSGAPTGDSTKPSFNFTAGAAPPAFGAAAPSFGSASTPAFGAASATAAAVAAAPAATPQFGAATPGMFNIGMSSPSQSRARIKAKRRI